MRVFVTGASGFIGSAVVRELLDGGHHVVGLARSDASATGLARAGVEVVRGDIENFDSLRAGAADADGVIHLAFIHDFADYARAGQTDRRAIETIGDVLAGSDRPFVVTAGTAGLTQGRVLTEDDAPLPGLPRASEEVALPLAARRVRFSVCGCRHPCTARVITASSRGSLRSRAPKRCLGLPGRRAQPLARGAPTRRRQPLSPRARGGSRGSGAAWRRRRGGAGPRYRRRHRPAPGATSDLDLVRRSGRPFRLARAVFRIGCPGVQHADPTPAGLAANPPRAPRRSRTGSLLRRCPRPINRCPRPINVKGSDKRGLSPRMQP